MSHTYATVADFKSHLTDNTSGVAAALDDDILSLLEGASRRVDAFCDRSKFGSGFGPRTGTNKYDGDGGSLLCLRDDLLSVTSITIYDSTASASSSTATADTDYYLRPASITPYREVLLHGQGSETAWNSGYQTVHVAGSWGYQATTASLGTAGTASGSATSLSLSGSPSAGMSLLIGTEQVYITAVSGSTATVSRAQNGTSAAVIAEGAAVSYYTYPSAVKAATLAIAQRRWKQRDAGLTGDFGYGPVTGSSGFRDSELSILRANVGHLRVYGA